MLTDPQSTRSADEAAFRAFVETYRARVLATIRTRIHPANDAEDVAQQVFTKAYFGMDRFDARGTLWAWLYRITVNECYDYLRKRRTRPLVYESELGSGDESWQSLSNVPTADDDLDAVLARRQLMEMLLRRLTGHERRLLYMKEVHGCSVYELAEMAGVTTNCVKVRLFRARQKVLRSWRAGAETQH